MQLSPWGEDSCALHDRKGWHRGKQICPGAIYGRFQGSILWWLCGSLTPTFLYRATIRMEIRGGGGMQPGDTATFGYCQRYFEISYSCVCIVSQELFVR